MPSTLPNDPQFRKDPPIPEFSEHAACQDHLELDFLEPTPSTVDAMLRVCRCCDAREECLLFRTRHGLTRGVWGGVRPRSLSHDVVGRGGRGGRPRQEIVHGAPGQAGAQAHRRRGEDPCEACDEAAKLYYREKREERLALLRGGAAG